MADYSDAYGPGPQPTYFESDVVSARKGGLLDGYESGFEAALIAVAKRRKKVDNAPLRCPLCESYMYEELHHVCKS